MGKLKPGATYIYERADGVTYARESGSTERHPVGWEFGGQLKDQMLWKDIHKEAEQNPALQKVLNRAIMIYRLSKDNPQ
jgi:hypothetical protein